MGQRKRDPGRANSKLIMVMPFFFFAVLGPNVHKSPSPRRLMGPTEVLKVDSNFFAPADKVLVLNLSKYNITNMQIRWFLSPLSFPLSPGAIIIPGISTEKGENRRYGARSL